MRGFHGSHTKMMVTESSAMIGKIKMKSKRGNDLIEQSDCRNIKLD